MSKWMIFLLKLFGWSVKGNLPPLKKYVLIGAPHTSNWDFVLMMAASMAFGKKFSWMGKDNLFIGPLGAFFKKLGGIPINRRISTKTVAQAISAFNEKDSLVMVITPEGTRKKVSYWKTGFYYIASGANIPVLLGYVDYSKKIVGVGDLIEPSGDIERDMNLIREFYAGIIGRHPEKMGEIQVKKKKNYG